MTVSQMVDRPGPRLRTPVAAADAKRATVAGAGAAAAAAADTDAAERYTTDVSDRQPR
jgi:hypothetical protein